MTAERVLRLPDGTVWRVAREGDQIVITPPLGPAQRLPRAAAWALAEAIDALATAP